MTNFVIACDIDEVLFPYLAGYCKYYNRVHATTWQMTDFHSYNFCQVHGGTRAEIADLVYSFHDEPEFAEIEPLTGALEAVAKLAQLGEVHFVTARQTAIAGKTRDWIKTHFGFEPERVHIGNHFTRAEDKFQASRSKLEMCKHIGANVLIDDSATYAVECAAAGMTVLLFDLQGQYGWNKAVQPHPNITRVHNWEEALTTVQACMNKLS